MPDVQGIHHTTAFAKSLKENHYFYTQILGLRLVKQTVHQDNSQTPHLFYGDYLGSVGSLLSFFIYPKMGRSYQNDHYYKMITLAIPIGSSLYWKNHLTSHGLVLEELENDVGFSFSDPDGLRLTLLEADEHLAATQINTFSVVPAENQIIRIIKASIHVNNPELERDFYKTFLNLTNCSRNKMASPFEIQFSQTLVKKKTRIGRGSIDHLAFSVKEAHDLDIFMKKAESLGYTVEKLVDRHYFKSLYVLSPSGLRVELATEKPGMTIDESLETLGNNLITFDKHEEN